MILFSAVFAYIAPNGRRAWATSSRLHDITLDRSGPNAADLAQDRLDQILVDLPGPRARLQVSEFLHRAAIPRGLDVGFGHGNGPVVDDALRVHPLIRKFAESRQLKFDSDLR